jgi:hypothetical protein
MTRAIPCGFRIPATILMPSVEMIAGMLLKDAFPGFVVLGSIQPKLFGQSS